MFFFTGASAPPPLSIAPIALVPEQLPISPKEFYIADIIDERANTKAVAHLLASSVAPATATQPVDFEGGGLVAIKNYIKEGLPANRTLRPIIVRLKEYQVVETPGANGMIEGKATISVAFEVKREGQVLHLLNYASGAKYSRPAKHTAVVGTSLRKTLAQSLLYLNTWIDREASTNEKLARSIKVQFIDYTQNAEDDTVFYDVNRPLQWADFQGGTPRKGAYAASIFPFISNDIHATIENSVIQVTITVKPYMIKSLSRVRPDAKTDYGLNHEQRHFDILKLVTEHYKQRIRNLKLTLADYDSQIKYQYLEELWELDTLQTKYDGETNHGINSAAQAHWNQKIDEELKALGLKK
ncbi:MAG: hypothetical protein ACO1OQ_05465 [Rufibacter sp.]